MKKTLLLILAACLFQFAHAAEYSCDDGKRYCKEMDSCAEAKFYLNQCGVSRLDRDNDGIPCESICRK